MTPKKNKGMWLRESQRDSKAGCEWILLMASALVASTVLILTVLQLTGFIARHSPLVMLITSGCCCVVYGILLRLQRQPWFYSGALVIGLVLVLLFGKQLLDGICQFWNQIGDAWTAATGYILPELQTSATTEGMGILVFSVFFGIISAVACCALASCRLPVITVALPGLLLIGMGLFHKDGSFFYIIPVLLVSVFLLVVNRGKEKKQTISNAIGRILPAVIAGTLALVIASLPFVQSFAFNCSTSIHNKLHIDRYETEYTTLPEGDFSEYRDHGDARVPGLIVNMDIPENLYLRGFTGVTFDGNTWSAIDSSVLAENEDLLYWLNMKEFHLHAQYEQAIFQSDIAKNTITIQNIGACSQYLYVPFNLSAGNYLQPESINPDCVMTDGKRIYVISTVSGNPETILQTLENLQTSEEEAVINYRKAESAYRDFVYSNYLQIPKETLDLLQEHWDDVAANYGPVEQLTHEQAQDCVITFLKTSFSEEEKGNAITLPLENAMGTSYQYATVAALTLRYFGIPARYAEGYIITEEMAAAKAGSNIEADSSCAGGWVELYQDGIGWIPMDLTPGFEEVTQNPDNDPDSTQKNPGKPEPDEGEEPEEKPDDQIEEPDPNGGYMVALSRAFLWTILMIVGLLVLLILLLLFRHRLYLQRKQKLFDAEDRKNAVAWIFADVTLLLERMGFYRGKGSMQALIEPVRQRFGDDYAKEYERMVDLNAQALFSSREMRSEDWETAKEFRAVTLQHLRSNAKWHQKLWMQWVLCLY